MKMEDNNHRNDDLSVDQRFDAFLQQAVPDDVDISAVKKRAFLKIRQHERRSKVRRVALYVTSVAAALLLLMGINYRVVGRGGDGFHTDGTVCSLTQGGEEEMVVPVGEKSTLMLADGTKVVANSRTIIRYPKRFEGKNREIYVRGEAFFDVAKDEEHPFVVHSDDFLVKVLGTRFNVNNYNDSRSQVVLVQGAVELNTSNHERVRMKPNELVSIDKGSFTEKRAVDTDEYTCWMRGMINLSGENVQTIIKRLSQYYGVIILCDDEISGNKLYGRLMLSQRVGEVMKAIESMTDAFMSVQGDTIYLIRER